MPPSIVLEVVKILSAEVNLREQTRSLHQSNSAVAKDQFSVSSRKLAERQIDLKKRLDSVIEKIRQLPNARAFANELNSLGKAALVMNDAQMLLAKSETGSSTIAAETEAIEQMLKAKREKGNGGGNSSGGGSSSQSAIARMDALGTQVGSTELAADSQSENRTDLATGLAGRELPEEYRSGLDRFFEKLEKNE